MRSVLMLVLGLMAGAIGGSMALRALTEGSEYPRGVMAIMGVHLGAVRQAARAGTCEAAAMARHAATLRQVALDIEPAFLPTGGDDTVFRRNAERLREHIGLLDAASGRGCQAILEASSGVGEACKACHRDFR